MRGLGCAEKQEWNSFIQAEIKSWIKDTFRSEWNGCVRGIIWSIRSYDANDP